MLNISQLPSHRLGLELCGLHAAEKAPKAPLEGSLFLLPAEKRPDQLRGSNADFQPWRPQAQARTAEPNRCPLPRSEARGRPSGRPPWLVWAPLCFDLDRFEDVGSLGKPPGHLFLGLKSTCLWASLGPPRLDSAVDIESTSVIHKKKGLPKDEFPPPPQKKKGESLVSQKGWINPLIAQA